MESNFGPILIKIILAYAYNGHAPGKKFLRKKRMKKLRFMFDKLMLNNNKKYKIMLLFADKLKFHIFKLEEQNIVQPNSNKKMNPKHLELTVKQGVKNFIQHRNFFLNLDSGMENLEVTESTVAKRSFLNKNLQVPSQKF